MTASGFRSMGCEIIVAGADAAALHAIVSLFEERDRTFSRFRDESELNSVNANSGRPTCVSMDFAAVVALALEAARETGGLVDPTVGAALEAAGYDADFARLRDRGRPEAASPGSWRSVRLVGRHVFVPTGVKLDLNGVVKAMTVDDALSFLPGDGYISAGGDIAVRGGCVVALPAGGTVRLVRGALATSGTDRRRWLRGGLEQHHLIDPGTGRPSQSPWRQVTVCGAHCVAADVAAKAAFLLGRDGPDWLDERGVPGRFVDSSGAVVTSRRWAASMEREAACT